MLESGIAVEFQDIMSIANIRHLLEVMQGSKTKYRGVDNGNGFGSTGCGCSNCMT